MNGKKALLVVGVLVLIAGAFFVGRVFGGTDEALERAEERADKAEAELGRRLAESARIGEEIEGGLSELIGSITSAESAGRDIDEILDRIEQSLCDLGVLPPGGERGGGE